MDLLKQQRTSAKSRFTRTVNVLLNKVADNQDSDDSLIILILDDVKHAWQNVNEKHDAYISELLVSDTNGEADDIWINDIQKTFYDVQGKVNAFRNEIKNKHIIENARRSRDISYNNFRSVCLELEETLAMNSAIESVERQRNVVQSQFVEAKMKHNELLQVSKDISTEQQDWLSKLIKELAIANKSIDNHIKAVTPKLDKSQIDAKNASTYHGTVKSNLQLEKFPLPKFDGDIRSYPRFRKDFMEMVLPMVDEKQSSFVLRNCMSKEIERSIASCEDDVHEIIERLDDKYGDPSKLTDTIINEIKRFKQIEGSDPKGLIEFVSVIENGYNDLKVLKLENEVCNSNIVSIIESKLPRSLALEWYREIHKDDSKIDKRNKFPHILKFLKIERKALEYGLSDLRVSHVKYGKVNEFNAPIPTTSDTNVVNCIFHSIANHQTYDCRIYLSLTVTERFKNLQRHFACYNCLIPGHLSVDCPTRKICGINNCDGYHHPSLHQTHGGTANASLSENSSCLLQIMRIPVKSKHPGNMLNVFWDSGATISLIRNQKAIELGLKGTPVTLNVTTVGGVERRESSYKYQVHLINQFGQIKVINAYSMERITNEISSIDINTIEGLISNIDLHEICRPSGTVDLLIGFEYAAWHPVKVKACGHLLVLSNMFGKCLGGSHPLIREKTELEITNASVNLISLSQFFSVESMGIESLPKCSSCRKCANCNKSFTLKEERELAIIEKLLIHESDHFEVTYPWTKDPKCLPNNKSLALKRLFQLEKRLSKDSAWKRLYSQQMQDMFDRRVARKITEDEIRQYNGPVHYITHHAVKKASSTTPIRIVFNSSLNFNGHALNDYWAKGPADGCVNNLLKILIRFRENECGFAGDISKMYHMIKISQLDQHTHRFLWREDSNQPVDTFMMTSVSFGDKPAGAIAIVALRKTAEFGKSSYPEASSVIRDSSYVDDIIDSVDSYENALSLTSDIDTVLKIGGFTIKNWTLSGGENKAIQFNAEEKILGIIWNPSSDSFHFKVKMYDSLNYKMTPEVPSLTKRVALSVVNGLFDPLGLVSPIVVRGKILLRQMTAIEPRISWDDKVPEEHIADWQSFLRALSSLQNISFKRCVKPSNAIGLPTLVTFSDASINIYGTCCYIRWETTSGEFKSKLLISKNRVAPVKRLTIVRLELLAALLAARIRQFVTTNCRYKFSKFIHIVDSEIVRAMIQKESYGFNTFVGTRIGEIQTHTDPSEWYWIKGNANIADIITRGADSSNIGLTSVWQNGPDFMSKAVESWPISNSNNIRDLPERNKIILTTIIKEENSIIDIERFSKYVLLMMVTARILALKKHPSLMALSKTVSANEFRTAEEFWVIEAQKSIKKDLIDGIAGRGSFRRFTPKLNEAGIIVIGGRAERWVEISYNKQELPILPKDHRLSFLYARYIHCTAHLGIDADIAKIRAQYWILGLPNIVKSIRNKCVTCRKKYLQISRQVMGKLPEERLKPAPAFFHSMVDLFGPYLVRGEVNKRASMKVYGVLITDLLTRAVYVDVAADYTTDSFLMVFRRFVCLHGYPNVIFSDRGSQLVSASQELKGVVANLDWDKVKKFGGESGLSWKFSPPESPWWNGCAEALVRSVKKAITHAIGDSRLTFSEVQTVFFECANLVNERPIGVKPSKEQDFVYLCPNDMLLGRSTSKLPHGSFSNSNSLIKRLRFVETLVNSFWTKWSHNYFPSLLIQQKWHHTKRNAAVGDIAIIQDNDLTRGQWKLGRINKVTLGIDDVVRRVEIEYKNKGSNRFTIIERSVQRIIVILPVEEINH